MSRNPGKHRRAGPATRGPALLEGKTFLIVTEGEKTEPNYLAKVRERLRLHSALVEVVHPPATDPVSLVEYAIKRKKQNVREARKGSVAKLDEVWVVFDLEKIHDERRSLTRQARDKANANDIRLAVSDPCFEFWLLLHFEFTTAPLNGCEEAVNRLVPHWPGYAKGVEVGGSIVDRVPGAVTHAERCRQHHLDCSGSGNPSTDVDKLIRAINVSARPHHRLLPVSDPSTDS